MRWIYDKARHDFVPAEEYQRPVADGLHVMNDIKPFFSPVSQSMITSRSELRAHNERYGVRQVGNDWSAKDYGLGATE